MGNHYASKVTPHLMPLSAAYTWPSQLGLYNFDSSAGPTTVGDFALTGVASANGHSWTLAYTSCPSAGDKYSFR
jgi:hypothetical protein